MLDRFRVKCQRYPTKYSFGATSAIITNLGLIAGLSTGEHAKLGIIGGILIIAIADNISDSLGIHVYQESECLGAKDVWISTCTNFVTRLLVSLTFIFIVLSFPMKAAVLFSIIWGLLLLSVISYIIARNEKVNPYLVILEHICIAAIVIIASSFLGKLLITRFKL